MDFNYTCSDCHSEYASDPELMLCPRCSQDQNKDQPLAGILEVVSPVPDRPEADTFAYLPIERAFFPPIPVGNAPLWRPERLRQRYGFS